MKKKHTKKQSNILSGNFDMGLPGFNLNLNTGSSKQKKGKSKKADDVIFGSPAAYLK